MKNLILTAVLFSSASALAAPAVSYSCVGRNSLNKEAVVFELTFSDYAREAGYTNQSVTITKSGGLDLKKPLTLQMFDATQKNHCKKNSQGEINMSGDFEMDGTEAGNRADFKVSFRAECGGDVQYAVSGYCWHQY